MGTERIGRRWLCLVGAVLFVAPAVLPAQQLVPGDTLRIRLLDRVRSNDRERPAVRALVIAPIAASNGKSIIPPGSVLTGRVTGVGMEHFNGKRHWLALSLDSIAVPIGNARNDTTHAAVSMRIALVDDARESVDSAGRIVGPPIPSILRLRNWAIALFGIDHTEEAILIATMLEGEQAVRHRAVSLEAGTELSTVVTGVTTLARYSEWRPPPLIAGGVSPELIAAAAPLRAALRRGDVPSDIIGVALVGSAAQVREAFAAAGWTRAVPMTVRNDFITLVKTAQGQGYEAQPVSELVLHGRAPDEVYEKVADTFLRRHHFRMWHWPAAAARDDGAALWLLAATHDTGLMFSSQLGSFTHSVDPRIDLERDKIVSDLIAAERVAAVSYVARAVPGDGATVNGGRADMVTDWRMAVVQLK